MRAEDALWIAVLDADGVAVSRLAEARNGVNTFRAVMVVDAAVSEILAILSDYENRTEWMSRCAESRVLERRADGVVVIYQRNRGVWPISDRDAVVAESRRLRRATPRSSGSTTSAALSALMSALQNALD